MKTKLKFVGLCAGFAGLMGCSSMAPKYERPPVEVPTAYKETGSWSKAVPQDHVVKKNYWELFNDPELNALQKQVDLSNQNIAAAFAAFLQARTLIKQAQAQYYPTISVSANASRQQTLIPTPAGPPTSGRYSQFSVPLDATWVPDLWGRIGDTVDQNVAKAQMSAADLENQRLVQHIDLGVAFYQLRTQDALQKLYNEAVVAYTEALNFTRVRFSTGIDSDESVAQAEVQLKQTQAQATQIGIARAQYEHAIALLVGKPASNFSIPVKPLDVNPPKIPLGVPSQLLQRRPDVASAERAMAAANSQIGVAKSAYFPDLTLSGEVGVASTALNSLVSAPTLIWSLGAGLVETVFDGGARSAAVDQARAAYDQTVATYRQTVLTAFQQVEDGLAALRLLEKQLKEQREAVVAAKRNLKIATARYRLGIDPYLNVITAQTALITAQQSEITLRGQQLTTSMQLVEAMGGSWDSEKLPTKNELKD